MRGIGSSRGSRASAAGPLRGASVGAVALLLLLGGWFVAPGGAQVSSDDETTSTEGVGDADQDELPDCSDSVGGLELATTLDFATVVRPFSAEGGAAGPTGEIVSYELYCPYGDLPPSAPSDSAAPLGLLLSWAVAPAPDAPGCFEADEATGDSEDGEGVVGDPERAAQVDWSVTDDQASAADAEAAAADLLASAPDDTLSCEEANLPEEEAGAAPTTTAADEPATRLPLLVIGAALAVCLLAGILLLARRRSRGDRSPPTPEPAGPAVGPSQVPGPLIAGATAPQRAVRSLPPEVLTSMAAAGEATPRRSEAVVDAARRASADTVGHHAAALGLVAAAAGTLAAADAARLETHPDEQVRALAAALRTLARGAARSARRAAEVQPGAPSAELDELVRATQRLVDAHRTLLQPPARTETPR